MKKLQILVCAHKADKTTRNSGCYTAIQVGKILHPELDLGFLKDDVGDNISEKNQSFSEWTALYWGWKNIHDTEYMGLCHYRRYFDCEINEQNIDSLLCNDDILVIKNNDQVTKSERIRNLSLMTTREDCYIFLDTLVGMYPQFKEKIVEYFCNSYESVPYSMFIARKEVYNQFCEFMFPLLFTVEKRVKLSGYGRQRRAFGYFGEFCLGLFISCYNLITKKIPLKMYNPDGSAITLKWSKKRKLVNFIHTLVDLLEPTKHEIIVPTDVRVGLKGDGIELKYLP